jgi:hypothetical protein
MLHKFIKICLVVVLSIVSIGSFANPYNISHSSARTGAIKVVPIKAIANPYLVSTLSHRYHKRYIYASRYNSYRFYQGSAKITESSPQYLAKNTVRRFLDYQGSRAY